MGKELLLGEPKTSSAPDLPREFTGQFDECGAVVVIIVVTVAVYLRAHTGAQT